MVLGSLLNMLWNKDVFHQSTSIRLDPPDMVDIASTWSTRVSSHFGRLAARAFRWTCVFEGKSHDQMYLHQGNRNKTWFSPQDMQGCNRERKENCRTWVLQCCKSFGLPGSGCSLPIQHGQAHHHWCRLSGPHHWPVLYPRHQPRLGRKQKAQHDEQVSSQKHDRTILNVKIYVIVCCCYIIVTIGHTDPSTPLLHRQWYHFQGRLEQCRCQADHDPRLRPLRHPGLLQRDTAHRHRMHNTCWRFFFTLTPLISTYLNYVAGPHLQTVTTDHFAIHGIAVDDTSTVPSPSVTLSSTWHKSGVKLLLCMKCIEIHGNTWK